MTDKVSNVYAVAGAKGGVGKTTTSINLGAALSAGGYDVVVVELDLAMANLVDFLDVDIDVTVATTLHDVLSGETAVEEAIYPAVDGLDVVPSGTDLDGYAETDLARLPAAIETLRGRYDAILLDTPAGLSEETVRPMQLADAVVLVSTPRVSSIRNADNTLELAERVGTDVRGLVLAMSGTGTSPGADRIAAFLDVDLLGHVPDDDAVPHAQDRGEPVVENAPHSGAAVAYRKIARGLTGASTAVESAAPACPDAGNGAGMATDRQRTDGGQVRADTAGAADAGARADSTLDEGGGPAVTDTASAPDDMGGATASEGETASERDGTVQAEDRSLGQKVRAVFGL